MGGPGLIDGHLVNSTDNFLPSKFVINGIEFYSAENYFQCAKCELKEEFEKVRKSGCGNDVWYAGSHVQMKKKLGNYQSKRNVQWKQSKI